MFAVLLALSATTAGAQAPTVVIESGGSRVELQGSGAQCVATDGGLHCTPSAVVDGGGAAQAGSSTVNTVIAGSVAFINSAANPAQVIISVVLPVSRPAGMIFGSVGGSTSDGNLDGAGGLGTFGGFPVYEATIDSVPVATLLPDPTTAPGPMFPGTFSARGASANVPKASFGLTPPGQMGPAVMSQIGFNLRFQVAAGDSAAITALFGLQNAPAASAATSPQAAAAAQNAPIQIRPLVESASAEVCPQRVRVATSVTNLSSAPTSVMVVIPQAVTPLAATIIGGSVAGAVLDANVSGTGGLSAFGTAPFYQGTADMVAVPAAQLYPAPFTIPTAGMFAAPGDTALMLPVSFGLSGPSVSGPAVTSQIAVTDSFTLGAFDAVVFTGVFLVDCPPTPTPTPSETPTVTPTSTPTPVPQGGGCDDTAQCVGGLFCADGVCCDTPCDGPQQQCNLRSNVGTCSPIAAAAPAASPTALLATLGALIGIAALALRRAR